MTAGEKWVMGADGCKAGWVGVRVAACGPPRPSVEIYENFRAVMNADASVVAADILIGLLEESAPGGRCADIEARRILGHRRSCVFPAPSRPMVQYAAARKEFESGRGMSRQAWHICPKIREVDGVVTPGDQSRIHECHPEVCFLKMRGEPMPPGNKKRPAGRKNRRDALLAEGFPEDFLRRRFWRGQAAGWDDLFDACAAAWTARRIHAGTACRLPSGNPPKDKRGLMMAMRA